ncbi:MAG TPA: hypothetical protein VHX66_06855 [Solirubrobacteraceae bacterium]|nr:hypothetical protein [Solirubrobacteraceae bacterium]
MDESSRSTIPVPVALFVYRRHELLPRTLRCLRDSGVDALYVFSDGPADASAQADVGRVRELIAAIDWIAPSVSASERNLGLSASIRAGLDTVFASHPRAIVIEDDVCVAPEFCAYAKAALETYEREPQVAGITGLRYPFSRRALRGYRFDAFMSPRFCSWSWATWGDRWERFEFDHEVLRRRLRARAGLRLTRAGADMPWMIRAAIEDESMGGSWDVDCAASMLLDDQYFVTPTWNMVENSGLSEGTHDTGRPPAWKLAWEPEYRPDLGALRLPPVAEDERVLRAYRRFFALGPRRAVMAALPRLRSAAERR